MTPMLLGDDPRAMTHGRRLFWRGFWCGYVVAALLTTVVVNFVVWWLE